MQQLRLMKTCRNSAWEHLASWLMHCNEALCMIVTTLQYYWGSVVKYFCEVLLKKYILQTSQSTEQVMCSKLVMWTVQPVMFGRSKIAPESLFCLMRQNRHCLSNAKISVIGNEKIKTLVSAHKNLIGQALWF